MTQADQFNAASGIQDAINNLRDTITYCERRIMELQRAQQVLVSVPARDEVDGAREDKRRILRAGSSSCRLLEHLLCKPDQTADWDELGGLMGHRRGQLRQTIDTLIGQGRLIDNGNRTFTAVADL